MLQPFHTLRGADQTAGAAAHRIARLAVCGTAAFRAKVRENIGLGGGAALAQVDIGNFGDHIARAVDLHPIADADIFSLADRVALRITARDIIFIVQRGVGYHDTAHGHRHQTRDRRDCPGATDLQVNRQQPGPGQFRREFMRNRPAGGGRAKPEPFLQGQVVDLVDHAINVIAKCGAQHLDLAVFGDQISGSFAEGG